jgi:threonine dehydratase
LIKQSQVNIHDIREAKKRIKEYVVRTPLIEIESNVYMKAEHKQVTKSFKPRGACNALLKLPAQARQKGVITRSSGNFAQGLSYMGNKLGVPVTVVMPENAPNAKIEGTKKWGAKVLLKGTTHDEAQALVDEISEIENLTKMHPFNDNHVIAGQGTAMLEICEELKNIDIFFCPLSGGGLMAGCAAALKHINPNAVVVAVEPEGASDYKNYRESGQIVRITNPKSVADGLLAPFVGSRCLPILDSNVDEVICVSDESIIKAMNWVREEKGELLEPSGAASIAAYLKYKTNHDTDSKCVVCLASGGNYDDRHNVN